MTAHTSEDTDIVHGRLARELSSALGEDAVTQRWVDRLKYAHDASHYLLPPQAFVTPSSVADVAEVMRACSRLGVPLTFRGGGTCLSGQALTDCVLVDTRNAFRGVEVLDDGPVSGSSPGSRCGRSTPCCRGTAASSGPTRRARSPAPSAG